MVEALIEIGYMGLFSEAASRGSVLDDVKYRSVLFKFVCYIWIWLKFCQETLYSRN